jgi:hypothetical protein
MLDAANDPTRVYYEGGRGPAPFGKLPGSDDAYAEGQRAHRGRKVHLAVRSPCPANRAGLSVPAGTAETEDSDHGVFTHLKSRRPRRRLQARLVRRTLVPIPTPPPCALRRLWHTTPAAALRSGTGLLTPTHPRQRSGASDRGPWRKTPANRAATARGAMILNPAFGTAKAQRRRGKQDIAMRTTYTPRVNIVVEARH